MSQPITGKRGSPENRELNEPPTKMPRTANQLNGRFYSVDSSSQEISTVSMKAVLEQFFQSGSQTLSQTEMHTIIGYPLLPSLNAHSTQTEIDRENNSLAQQFYKRMLAHLKKMAEDNPNDEVAQSNVGQAYLMLKIHSKAIEHYSKVSPNQSLYAEAQFLLGTCYFEQEAYLNSMEHFINVPQGYPRYERAQQSIKKCKEFLAVTGTSLSQKNLDRGNDFFAQNNYVMAIGYFNKVLQADPDDDSPHMNLGHSYRMLKNHPKAIEHYSKVHWDNPKYTIIQEHLANCYYYQENYIKAIEVLNKIQVLESARQYGSIQKKIGHCYKKLGDCSKAIEHYKKVQHDHPDLIEAHLNLGNCYLVQQDYQNAIGYYKKVIESGGVDQRFLAWAQDGLGDCYLEENEYQSAVECYKKVIELGGPDQESLGHAQFHLGECYFKQKDYQTAIDHYGKVPEDHALYEDAKTNIEACIQLLNEPAE